MAQGKLHEPTDETRSLVREYASKGMRQVDIAGVLELDEKTVRKYYKNEYRRGKADAILDMGGFLFDNAKKGDTTAQIFWLKTQAQWSETSIIEVDLPALFPNITPKGQDDSDDDE